MLGQRRVVLILACATLALGLVSAEITEPSNCGLARGRFSASVFASVVESVSGQRHSAQQVYQADSVSVVLVYNGEENVLPVYHKDSAQHYLLDLPETLTVTVASVHLELRDKENASHVLERTQSVVFWSLPQGVSAADWRPASDDIDLMVKLSQHLKGQGELHGAMQASRCVFDRQQPRTFQTVGSRIEFICALAALSPAQQPLMREALELATQLQVLCAAAAERISD
jgi:hypothetical protein